MLKKASIAMFAAAAAIAVNAGSAHAGSLQLGNSGWTASWSPIFDNDLSLGVDFVGTDTVFIEKHATFGEGSVNQAGFIDPIVIEFQQTSSHAVPFIAIDDEQVVNKTGLNWNGFKFTILGGSTGTSQDVQFDTVKTDVAPPGSGFSIDPFTTHLYSNNNQILEVGGGSIPSTVPNNVWFPGQGANTALYMHVSPIAGVLREFTLKEQPTPGGHVIPLPAAAWSGLTGLAGLALMGSKKQVKRLFA
jgi:hypothetical protein